MRYGAAVSIACLPWYDFEEIRPYTDRFWFGLVARLAEAGFDQVPSRLLREVHHDEILAHPDLLLSQTCGFVAASEARSLVELVATPMYSAPGCTEANYSSRIVIRKAVRAEELADTRGLRCVVNEPWSHSGVNALRTMVAPMHRDGRFFASVDVTGSHLASLQALRSGRADVACIDCVTFELVRRHRPEQMSGLRILCSTPPAPAPPFVTTARASSELVHALKDAIAAVLTEPANEEVCAALLLEGVEHLEIDAYDGMLIDAQRARDLGYAEMTW
jgi:ABC-type phosphate/phosphonate transport system substrate-binding protein